jgi:hypothetical protein
MSAAGWKRKLVIVSAILLIIIGVVALVIGLYAYFSQWTTLSISIALMSIGSLIIIALVVAVVIWWLRAFLEEDSE